jgi:phosphoribosyl-dephospho-CoA transferase
MGNDDAVVEDMKQGAKDWSQQIKKSTLKDHEAHTAMNITIMKKLEYPLVAANLNASSAIKSEHTTSYVITKGRIQS